MFVPPATSFLRVCLSLFLSGLSVIRFYFLVKGNVFFSLLLSLPVSISFSEFVVFLVRFVPNILLSYIFTGKRVARNELRNSLTSARLNAEQGNYATVSQTIPLSTPYIQSFRWCFIGETRKNLIYLLKEFSFNFFHTFFSTSIFSTVFSFSVHSRKTAFFVTSR